MSETRVIGYTYKSQTLCPTCTIKATHHIAYPTGKPFTPERAERLLDVLARIRKVDRDDWYSFLSDEFPKPFTEEQCGPQGAVCEQCETVMDEPWVFLPRPYPDSAGRI